MAPKNAPPAAKQAKILDWFKETMGVYTLSQLEKLLPSIAAINGMQVKEYLQALTDESLLRCEKIGSGNWFWCFTSDARKGKENQMKGLQAEEEKLREAIAEVEAEVRYEMGKREEDEEMLDGALGGVGRKELLEIHGGLVAEEARLDAELTLYCDYDPVEVMKKIEETKGLKERALKWTDNLESIESYLITLLNGDRAQVANFMAQACGDEYVPGEGLTELSGT